MLRASPLTLIARLRMSVSLSLPASRRRCSIALAAVAALFGAPVAAAADAAVTPGVAVQTVDTLEKLAGGRHAGFRANHAKGVLATGTFVATGEAKTLSKAAHLQGTPVPVIVRFSNATGVPDLPDAHPGASPHGIAIRFQLPGAGVTDIVSISHDGFPVATPEDFLGLLNAIAASGPEAKKPTPVETFLGSHPAAKAFATAPKPAPVSYATLPFFGVNAFKFTNAAGTSVYTRYRIVPVAGDQRLSDADAAKAAPNYLVDDLGARLAKGPIAYSIKVQLAKDGENVNDATKVWDSQHAEVTLGTLTLDALLADGAKAEKSLFFNPLLLVDGIAPSADPILLARPGAYAVSVGRRVGK